MFFVAKKKINKISNKKVIGKNIIKLKIFAKISKRKINKQNEEAQIRIQIEN